MKKLKEKFNINSIMMDLFIIDYCNHYYVENKKKQIVQSSLMLLWRFYIIGITCIVLYFSGLFVGILSNL